MQLTSHNLAVLRNFFRNSKGPEGSLRVYKGSENLFSKSFITIQNLNSILVDDCEFENCVGQKKKKNSLVR